MTEPVVITKAVYLASAVRRDQYPEEGRPAVAFIGRSNVGKSSLINSLTRIRQLARVSSKPGKTQTINFYELLLRIDGGAERYSVHLVDLPGYGYAKAAGRYGRSSSRSISSMRQNCASSVSCSTSGIPRWSLTAGCLPGSLSIISPYSLSPQSQIRSAGMHDVPESRRFRDRWECRSSPFCLMLLPKMKDVQSYLT